MMRLFPLIDVSGSGAAASAGELPLYRETDWNFRTNRPIWRGGNPVFVTGARAVLVWAWNALHTRRFAHDVFSSVYGADFGSLLGQSYTKEIWQAEAVRMVRETLLVNPYITGVSQIDASLEGAALHLRFRMMTVYGEVSLDGCDITI